MPTRPLKLPGVDASVRCIASVTIKSIKDRIILLPIQSDCHPSAGTWRWGAPEAGPVSPRPHRATDKVQISIQILLILAPNDRRDDGRPPECDTGLNTYPRSASVARNAPSVAPLNRVTFQKWRMTCSLFEILAVVVVVVVFFFLNRDNGN